MSALIFVCIYDKESLDYLLRETCSSYRDLLIKFL